jgi:acyl-CoA synthetase (AMP-forming)/AMP-acid ligase II
MQDDVSPFADLAFPCLRILTNSGGVFPIDLIARYREKLPIARIYLMYGLSEAFRSSYLPPEEIDLRPSSMGKAIPGCELFVLDEADRECPAGRVGELVHRGPTVALGYWHDDEATARVFRDDPIDSKRTDRVVYSGDLVRRDEEGFLYFVSRRDQMIKSMGYRISPEDVEEQLQSSGLLLEVIVGGRPDAVAGSVVVAHIVPVDSDRFDEDELVRFCRREMPSYMIPVEFNLHRALPRTSSGKFDRKRLLLKLTE